MRKSYDSAFKAKVALEALKEQMTLQELAQKYELHPVQISQWKHQLLEGSTELFERPNKRKQQEREAEEAKEELLKAVGRLSVENEFLKKKHRQLYGSEPT